MFFALLEHSRVVLVQALEELAQFSKNEKLCCFEREVLNKETQK